MNAAVDRIEWSNELATGLAEVDDQHRQLVTMLNALAELRQSGPDLQKARVLLYELRSYAGYHFRLEEDLMDAWPVDAKNKAAHIRAHASFVAYLRKAEAMMEQSSADTLDHLLAFLVKWLVHHITGVDARMVRELAALGMPLQGETRTADGEESRSVHDALVNTVSELYDSISVRTLELLESNGRLLAEVHERERAEAALRESEARYRALADNGRALIWMTDRSGDAEYFNRPWLAFSGRALALERGHGWLDGVHPDDVPQCREILRGAAERQEKFSSLWRQRRHDGIHRWLACEGTPRFDADGNFAGFVGHCLDITEHRAAEAHQQLAAQVFETMSEAVMVTDRRTCIERVNAAFTRITGYGEDEVRGRTPLMLSSLRHDAAFHQTMWQQLKASGVWVGEVWNRMKNGDVRPMWQQVNALRDGEGRVTHYVAVLSDLSEVRQAQALADQLAWRDALTGLGNRAHFMRQLEDALAAAGRDGGNVSVLLLDIDRFKLLNEARGLGTGDTVLVAVGAALTGAIEGEAMLARIDADEYAVLLSGLGNVREEAARVALARAERLRAALRAGVQVEGELLRLDCSIGIAMFPDATLELASDVVQQANLAMHQAKEAGGGCVQFFEARMGERVRDRYELELELRDAIDGGQLRLYLQSQFGPQKTVVGAEALVRWEHPQRGLLSPASFVPVAEASKLIAALDCWVLGEACRLLARLDAEGRALSISVNISPQHFQQPDFVEQVLAILRESGADGNHLVLEVTENLVIGDIEGVVAHMLRLQEHGIRFSLDDFGTGYSSLLHLKRLPIHEIKIDRSFVRDVTVDADDAAVVDTILAVARHMQLQVVAEGVETEAQAEFLDSRFPVVHQGYLYARPQEANGWLAALHRQAAAPARV